MRHILFSYRSPKYIDEQPQPCLGCRQDGTHQKRPLEQVLRQSVVLHPGVEPVAGVPFGPRNDKPSFRLPLNQPKIQKEQVSEIDHHPLDIPGHSQRPEPCCPTLPGTDRAIKQKGQQLPKTDPNPVKAVFRTGGRIFCRLDDGGRITGEHQPRLIQRHQSGKQVKVGRHSEPVQNGARPVHTHPLSRSSARILGGKNRLGIIILQSQSGRSGGASVRRPASPAAGGRGEPPDHEAIDSPTYSPGWKQKKAATRAPAPAWRP